MVFGEGSIVHLIQCGDYCRAVYRVDSTTEGFEPYHDTLHEMWMYLSFELVPIGPFFFMRAPFYR